MDWIDSEPGAEAEADIVSAKCVACRCTNVEWGMPLFMICRAGGLVKADMYTSASSKTSLAVA